MDKPSSASTPSSILNPPSSLHDRPREQRAREFRYRFGQACVFGIPILGLQWFGSNLGGVEAAVRWVPILQGLLATWIAYVVLAGMISEGVYRLLTGRRWTTDLIVALLGCAGYLFSIGSVLGVFISGRIFYRPLLFHAIVLVLIVWCAGRWRQLAGAARAGGESN